jgi:ribonuclease HII
MVTVGLDEVGRGALAGPMLVGAVALSDPEGFRMELAASRLKCADSKKLSAAQREKLFEFLHGRILWSVGGVLPQEIDALGLTAAVRLAAGRALDVLPTSGPRRIMADAGLYHPYENEIPTERLVKGDETILEIMLASVMAKVSRDRQMQDFATECPQYGWKRNVGYGTAAHAAAIRQYGLTPHHRRLFCKAYLN